MDRGEKHSGRRYRETAEMKRDLEQEVEELREQKAALIDEIAYKDGHSTRCRTRWSARRLRLNSSRAR